MERFGGLKGSVVVRKCGGLEGSVEVLRKCGGLVVKCPRPHIPGSYLGPGPPPQFSLRGGITHC